MNYSFSPCYCLILQIAVGDILCEIETDKATLEFESLEEGYFFSSQVLDGL